MENLITHNKAMELITKYLLTQSLEDHLLESAQRHIANCRQCIDELDATIRIITGKPPNLAEEAKKFLTCDECMELLPEQTEAEDDEIRKKYPLVCQHLQNCTKCRKAQRQLVDFIKNEKKGLFGPLPKGLTFSEVQKLKEVSSHFPTLTTLVEKLQSLMEKVFGNTLLRIRELSSEENVAVFNQKLRLCAGFAYERAFGQDDLEEMNKIAEDEEKLTNSIVDFVSKQALSEDIKKIALSLASALGKPDTTRLDQAIADLEQISAKTESAEVKLILAYCYRKRGSIGDAEEQLQKALRTLQKSWEQRKNKGSA